MRYKNDGPLTWYVVIDTGFGAFTAAYTNLKTARADARERNHLEESNSYKVLAYDQRGTR